jgi:hypothetical protein
MRRNLGKILFLGVEGYLGNLQFGRNFGSRVKVIDQGSKYNYWVLIGPNVPG